MKSGWLIAIGCVALLGTAACSDNNGQGSNGSGSSSGSVMKGSGSGSSSQGGQQANRTSSLSSVSGQVLSASDNSLQVQANGHPMALQLNNDTQIFRQGQKISQQQLRPGEQVRAAYRLKDGQAQALQINVQGAGGQQGVSGSSGSSGSMSGSGSSGSVSGSTGGTSSSSGSAGSSGSSSGGGNP